MAIQKRCFSTHTRVRIYLSFGVPSKMKVRKALCSPLYLFLHEITASLETYKIMNILPKLDLLKD